VWLESRTLREKKKRKKNSKGPKKKPVPTRHELCGKRRKKEERAAPEQQSSKRNPGIFRVHKLEGGPFWVSKKKNSNSAQGRKKKGAKWGHSGSVMRKRPAAEKKKKKTLWAIDICNARQRLLFVYRQEAVNNKVQLFCVKKKELYA